MKRFTLMTTLFALILGCTADTDLPNPLTGKPHPRYTISSAVDGFGSITPTGETEVIENRNQAYTYRPSVGYKFDSLLIDGVKTLGSNDSSYTFTNIFQNHSIVSYFSKKIYTITVSVPDTFGTVSPVGTQSILYDSSCTVTFTPKTGCQLDSVKLDGTKVSVTGNSYTISNVTANHSLVGYFSKITGVFYSISSSVNDTSLGSISPTGTISVPINGSQKFIVHAKSGAVLDSVTVDGIKTDNLIKPTMLRIMTPTITDTSLTLSNVTKSQTVKAWFTKVLATTYTVTGQTTTGGTISPLGATTVTSGGFQKFVLHANSGYKLDSVTVDGARTTPVFGSDTSLTLTNVIANKTVKGWYSAVAVTNYTLSGQTTTGGTISPLGTTTVASGGSQKFVFHANSGYKLDSVTVDGAKTNPVFGTDTSLTLTNITANKTIKAWYSAINSTTTVKQVETAQSHTLIVTTDGTLWATGSSSEGKFGDSTTGNRLTPVEVMNGITASFAGLHYSMILKTDGTLWATGNNYSGQFGDGTTIDKSTPVKIMADVASVSVGGDYTMIVKTDGTLWATGDNYNGQLGDGTTIDKSTPVKIMTDVASVSAWGYHTMIVKTDGTLWATGDNASGKLGDGTGENRLTPVMIMSGVRLVSAGYSHTMIVKTDGTLWATGDNYSGQCGDGTKDYKLTPVKIMNDVATVSAGDSHTMIIKTDGTLWATGHNYSGQLGDGTKDYKLTPVKIMNDVASVSAGESYTMIVKTDGTLWATGDNYFGQLGDGTATDKWSFAKINF